MLQGSEAQTIRDRLDPEKKGQPKYPAEERKVIFTISRTREKYPQLT